VGEPVQDHRHPFSFSSSEALKARLNLVIVHVLSDPPDGWTGEQGYINAAVFRRYLPPPYADHEYFICGPNVMMDAIGAWLDRRARFG